MKETLKLDDGLLGVGNAEVYQLVMNGFEEEVAAEYAAIKRRILSKFLTNVDGPVTSLWGRVPPVLAAALTARQSRVAERDVAEVLWHEFLAVPDFGERILAQALMDEEGLDNYLSANKARQIIKRIIDGFGDDSVREDAPAYIFFREVPVLSTLEMFRHPLLTGIEASTRYINWGEKVDGEYLYVFPKIIEGTEYEADMRRTLDHLFEVYDELWPKVWEYVAKNNPKPADMSEVAYKTAVHGRVCDDLRTLVPLSAMTNGGIEGNFRTLTEVIMDLRSSDNYETVLMAERINAELKKINPEFVAVTDSEHGRAWTEYKAEVKRATKNIVMRVPWGQGEDMVTVEVLNQNYRHDLVKAIVLSAQPGLTDLDLEMVAAAANHNLESYLSKLEQLRKNRRHKVPDFFEVVSLLVSFRKLTFGAAKDFNRHRKRNFQSDFDWSGNLGFDIPDDIAAIGGTTLAKYIEAQERTLAFYQKVAGRFPVAAKSVLTHGTLTRFTLGMGLGEAIWLKELRTIATGNPEYRRLAQEFDRILTAQIPELKFLGGFVDHNEYSLGRIKEAAKRDLRGRH